MLPRYWHFQIYREKLYLVPEIAVPLTLRTWSKRSGWEQPMPFQSSSNDSVKKLLPWLVAIAVFMEALDTTILNTAVPAIAEALKVAPLSMKAVLSSYTLSLAVFIPVSGWMADRYGTRRVFSAA